MIRLVYLLHIFLSHRLHRFLPKSRFLSLLVCCYPLSWFHAKKEKGENLKEALIKLGPVFIKFGQFLSIRRDFFREETIKELEQLTDNVPAFATSKAKAMIEKELGRPINDICDRFEKKPLASASLAQVHAGVLKNGDEVVFKILRPKVKQKVRRDIKLLKRLSEMIYKISEHARLINLVEISEFLEKNLMREIDLREEGNACEIMANNSKADGLLYMPKVYQQYSNHKLLVTERLDFIPVNQVDRIKEAGFDLDMLAKNGVKIFFSQVFSDNFFHADMHPGNIFVNKRGVVNNQYAAVDCAVIGQLSHKERLFLAKQYMSMGQGQYELTAKMLYQHGWLKDESRIRSLALLLEEMVEPIMQGSLKEIDMAKLIQSYFEVIRRFKINIDPNFSLFFKTLLYVEALGKQLAPNLNAWQEGFPIIKDWLKKEVGPKALAKSLQKELLHSPWIFQDIAEDFLSKNKTNQGENIVAGLKEMNNNLVYLTQDQNKK